MQWSAAFDLPRADERRYGARVASLEEFAVARNVWNGLVRSMREPSVFLTWEWIYSYWERFGMPSPPLIIFVYDNARLAAILPLVRAPAPLRVPLRIYEFCGARAVYSDHLDIIAAPGEARACLSAIERFFHDQFQEWDEIKLPMITSDSGVYRWMASAPCVERASRAQLRESTIAYYIPLEGTFDEYFERFDRKQRYNLRSRRKKLYAQGIRYLKVDVPSAEHLDILFDLHARRAKRKGRISSFGRPRVREFHEAFLARAADNGWISFHFLQGQGKAIAAAYNLEMGGRVYSYQKGIDPTWEGLGPGAVLLYELVQEAFRARRQEYNFLQGSESYKRVWTTQFRRLYSAHLYNDTLGGRVCAKVAKSIATVRQIRRRG